MNLTDRICWELVKEEGYIAIWRKPLSNSCYIKRHAGVKPPLCDKDDDPHSVWYDGIIIILQLSVLFIFALQEKILVRYRGAFSSF